MSKNNKKKSTFAVFTGTASVIGLHMVSGPLLGSILGYLFDNYFKTDPFGLIIGFIIGIVAGYRNVMEDAKKLQKEREDFEKNINTPVESDVKGDEYVEYELFGKHKKVKFDEDGNKTILQNEEKENQNK